MDAVRRSGSGRVRGPMPRRVMESLIFDSLIHIVTKEKLFRKQVRRVCMQTGRVGVIPPLSIQAHNADGSTPRLRNVSGVHLATVPHLVEGRASRRGTPGLDLAGRARRQERGGGPPPLRRPRPHLYRAPHWWGGRSHVSGARGWPLLLT